MSVYYGRVDFSGENMMPNYKKTPKLTNDRACSGLSYTGVVFTPEIHHGAKLMMVTTLPYFLIQVPAFFLTGDRQTVSDGEKWWAFAGFILCVVFFVYYMYTQLKSSNEGADKLRRMAVTKEALQKGAISLSGALAGHVSKLEKEHTGPLLNGLISEGEGLLPHSEDSLNEPPPEVAEYLKGVLGDVFQTYDLDGNEHLTLNEFSTFLSDFHEHIEPNQVEAVFSTYDRNSSGDIDYDEFISACYTIIKQATNKDEPNTNFVRQLSDHITSQIGETILGDDENDEEQEDVPEEFTDLSPEEQQRAIKRRAFTMLTIGTGLVLLFSDPMVDVLSETANRIGIPSFYVSFMLAPLASNASEVIASTYYAQKKTSKSITISLTALEGAASMNNTFCLSIFMALIYFRGLAWQYSAETISIILVQFGMGAWALRNKMSALTSMIVLSLFPLSVLFVALLEYLGMN
jgi:Ca2+/Na+ antiporter